MKSCKSIFTWETWYFEIRALNELLIENRANINEESISWIKGLIEKQKELYEVSEKFKQMIDRLSKNNLLAEENELLQQRIKDGAYYFYNEISNWKENFSNHPFSVDTKKLARKVDSKIEEINLIIEEKLLKINYCKNGFLLDDYLSNMKLFDQKVAASSDIKVKSSYRKRTKANTILETVKLLHEGKSIEQIAASRNLSVGTIESHLSRAIRQDLIQLEDVIPLNEAQKIAEHFPRNLDEFRLAVIKEKLPPEISYGKLRMVIAWLQKIKVKNEI